MSRQKKYSQAVVDAALERLDRGETQQTVARALGVSSGIVSLWKKAARMRRPDPDAGRVPDHLRALLDA